ncbi:MarR family winged helix-turn-helix transcriptional regulator [Plantibacter sp. YIM 135347]|uniref:MarR family winged helix-turn-helix transcriptional regulator n=1 Tax=Plantibacter sp. YIM 135347 TaxID=3423919 RepID=UPI003D35218F
MPVNPTDDRAARASDRALGSSHAVREGREEREERADRDDRAAARRDGRPVEDGDIRARLQQLTIRQQRFERAVALQLDVDAAGLDAMDHLLSAGPSTPTELAHRLEISTAAMTLVLNRLESAGHVRRERHPSDGRKLVVTASEESAEEAHGRVAPLIEGVEELIASMGDADLSVVEGFLERLVQVYDDATPAPPA